MTNEFEIIARKQELSVSTEYVTSDEAVSLYHSNAFKELQNWSFDAWEGTGDPDENDPHLDIIDSMNCKAVKVQLALNTIERLAKLAKDGDVKFAGHNPEGTGVVLDEKTLRPYTGNENPSPIYNHDAKGNKTNEILCETGGLVVGVDEYGEQSSIALVQLSKKKIAKTLIDFIDTFTLEGDEYKGELKDVVNEALQLSAPPPKALEHNSLDM